MYNFLDIKEPFEILIPVIVREACKILLNPLLIAAIAWQESEFTSWAFRFEAGYQARYVLPMPIEKIHSQNPLMKQKGTPSEKSERTALATSWGPMQIMGQTARDLGFRGQFLTELCGEAGIVYGVRYYQECMKRYQNNNEEALSAYNAGTTTPRNHADYVVPVLQRLEILQLESEAKKWLS